MSISICTLAHGRDGHLRNLVRGLDASNSRPDELVIAVMQDRLYDLPRAGFPVRQIMLGSSGIPLAAARNRAAGVANGETLVFLDVDCIPHPRLIDDYRAACSAGPGILMGEVAYLPSATDTASLDFAMFDRLGCKHSERAGPPETAIGRCGDYRQFWSLNFAMSAADFAAIGGFDEGFTGYGGEDTDFARKATTSGLNLWWARGARAYHQYHPHHMPPVHHIDSVIANAHHFLDKWGEPTMQHWLRAFVLMGLAEKRGGRWVKLREVDENDLAITRQQSHQPYASSSLVLEALEAERSQHAMA
ncbi:MAG: galactosyltransferase-related protein [Alteraurantiacibacter sp.]